MEVIIVTVIGDTAIEVYTGINATGNHAKTPSLKKQKISSDQEECITDFQE